MMKKLITSTFLIGLALSVPAQAQQCGGNFSTWKQGVIAEAQNDGISGSGIAALRKANFNRKVISRDRAQGVFTQTFLKFSGRMISSHRLKNGAANLRKYRRVFARAEEQFGVPGPVIAAFWALETDFGAVQGNFLTLDALATLAHDCRRPELFRPQLIALAQLIQLGTVPANVKGAWAGEIGQTQLLPSDYLEHGRDGDGDGRVDLKGSAPDAIMTAANFISHLGWRRGEPWLEEVKLPKSMPWEEARIDNLLPRSQWAAWGVTGRSGPLKADGLPAALLLPMGRKGPVFLAYRNFNIYLEWNQSFVYTVTAAYLATRLNGAPRYNKGNPSPGLSQGQMKSLQQKLAARGHDVGKIDGILGKGTRGAVRAEQKRLGLPADAWPTASLVSKL